MGTGRIIVPNRPITMHIQTPFDGGEESPPATRPRLHPKVWVYTARKKNGVSSFGILEACLSPPPKKRADKNFLSQKSPATDRREISLVQKEVGATSLHNKRGEERRALAPLS